MVSGRDELSPQRHRDTEGNPTKSLWTARSGNFSKLPFGCGGSGSAACPFWENGWRTLPLPLDLLESWWWRDFAK